MIEECLSADAAADRQKRAFLVPAIVAAVLTILRVSTISDGRAYYLAVVALGVVPTIATFIWITRSAPLRTRVVLVGRSLRVSRDGTTDIIPLTQVRSVEVAIPDEGESSVRVALFDAAGGDGPTISFVPRGPSRDRASAQSIATLLRREAAEAKRAVRAS